MNTKNIFERVEKNSALLVSDLRVLSDRASNHFGVGVCFSWVIGDGVCIDIEDGSGGLRKISAGEFIECLKPLDREWGLTMLRSLGRL